MATADKLVRDKSTKGVMERAFEDAEKWRLSPSIPLKFHLNQVPYAEAGH